MTTPITPVPDAALPLPDPADLATWAARMAEMHRWMRQDLRSGMNSLAEATYDNTLSAIAVANFKGAWSGLTGPLIVPASVVHSGKVWLLLTNLSDVTTSTPGISADWMDVTPVRPNEVVGITSATGSAKLPAGTTAERDVSPVNGYIRYNATIGRPEYFNGTEWVTFGRSGRIRQATTSGSAIDFTGIPAWATCYELEFERVSLNAADFILVQLGTGAGFVTSSYASTSWRMDAAGVLENSSTAGIILHGGNAGWFSNASLRITKPESGNLYRGFHTGEVEGAAYDNAGGWGRVTLPGPLTQIRVTRSGSGSFDNGAVTLYWS